MALLIRNRMDLHEKAMLENAVAENESMRAFIDYNIMMGNIEDPAEEEDEDDE